MSSASTQRSPEEFRLQVALIALELFQSQGFEATTVDHIAAAAGVSRRTLFRQFGSKDDMVFADHESLLVELDRFLAADDLVDPWLAVCESAVLVLQSFARTPELSLQRYQIQRSVPALRDREIVTSYRYERLFVDYLRRRVLTADDVTIVSFAAAVIATHNFLLRQALRRGEVPTAERLIEALTLVRSRFAPTAADIGSARHSLDEGPPDPAARTAARRRVLVATYPHGATNQEILDGIRAELELPERS